MLSVLLTGQKKKKKNLKLRIDGSMRADVFLVGAVAMVNRNFGAPLIRTFHSCGARAKLRVNLLRVE